MSEDNKLSIDIDDWCKKVEKILADGTAKFDTWDDIIKTLIVAYGLNSCQAGEILIAAAYKGILPDTLKWAEPKVHLSNGSGLPIRLKIKMHEEIKKLRDGREIKVREFLGRRKDIQYEETEEDLEEELEYTVSQPLNILEEDNNHDLNVNQVGDVSKNGTNGHNGNNGNGHNQYSARSSYVSTQSQQGIEAAKWRIWSVLLPEIRNRMAELAGLIDIEELAEEIKSEIDKMVVEFS